MEYEKKRTAKPVLPEFFITELFRLRNEFAAAVNERDVNGMVMTAMRIRDIEGMKQRYEERVKRSARAHLTVVK